MYRFGICVYVRFYLSIFVIGQCRVWLVLVVVVYMVVCVWVESVGVVFFLFPAALNMGFFKIRKAPLPIIW